MRALSLLALTGAASAQFGGFFDQMFGGQGQGGQRQPQNVPSDPSAYQHNYESCESPDMPSSLAAPALRGGDLANSSVAHCDKYLCPDTLGTAPLLPSA